MEHPCSTLAVPLQSGVRYDTPRRTYSRHFHPSHSLIPPDCRFAECRECWPPPTIARTHGQRPPKLSIPRPVGHGTNTDLPALRRASERGRVGFCAVCADPRPTQRFQPPAQHHGTSTIDSAPWHGCRPEAPGFAGRDDVPPEARDKGVSDLPLPADKVRQCPASVCSVSAAGCGLHVPGDRSFYVRFLPSSIEATVLRVRTLTRRSTTIVSTPAL